MKTESIVAYAAAKDGYSPDKICQILQHDPALVKIRERSGDAAVQNHLKIALRFADYQMRSHQQPQQINKQQSRQKPGWEISQQFISNNSIKYKAFLFYHNFFI